MALVNLDPPPQNKPPSSRAWGARAFLVLFMVGGAVLALSFRSVLAPRMAQNEAAHYLLAHQPLRALEVAETALRKSPNDGELRALALSAAELHVQMLTTQGHPSEARNWLTTEASTRPYLTSLVQKLYP